MPLDDRAQDLLDQLREGRGVQMQVNKELYRRMQNSEVEIQNLNSSIVDLSSKIDKLVNTVVGRVSAVLGLAMVIMALFQFVL